ncbi:MAG: UDP-N-acetylmuramoyl-tripeptide--D-alanyl-D-alanine ligase [Cyclobacteriaceae bacterium]|nr:UDP-N-acetylmuramoyl-tripeptide--D-alanyl-D-alanine ligase [Cyclobacteriaceae bacterium]MDH4296714.1 UDP-N-acetylmuramoyl-tripeptide--D-alanyl-D-alanine ligase [Cyclobacteriaceae bacterium]MDH5248931.1 UDP-N-acetylmuramoyl-tripeptide--D-alanyl-D-alanine ligase [Cyclobacteriaceae bacterium]
MDIEKLYAHFLDSGYVSTDTRKIVPGSIFFALKGERFNANAFAQSALEKGARYAVIDEVQHPAADRCILVDDVLKTLQDLARYHRNQLSIPFIGLTGSNGKTTSKELLAAVLQKKYNTASTKGNLNNHIGVPLTILEISKSTEIAIIEMGANHLGEIATLCSIANPTHGFITNIGKAHIGTFGGFENIIRAKSELYNHLIVHDGTVFINSQDEILSSMAKRFRNPIFYPATGDYYHCTMLGADPFVKIKTEDGEIVQTHLVGAYNFENVAAALCIGKYFGVDTARANEAVAHYVSDNMRSQFIVKGSNTIILDAYNANPTSMCAAIENLAAMKAKHKVLILGDMFELEGEAEQEHREIGRLLHKYNFDKVFLCGHLMKAAKAEFPPAMIFEDKILLADELKKRPLKNATILIKASRGVGLEAVLEFI